MTELADVVQGLLARDGVEAVVLLSGDGLPIEHAARTTLEADTVAALAASAVQHAERLGDGARQGELATAVLEYADGLVLLARAGASWLAVLAHAEADLAPLVYDLRLRRPALASLL